MEPLRELPHALFVGFLEQDGGEGSGVAGSGIGQICFGRDPMLTDVRHSPLCPGSARFRGCKGFVNVACD